MRMTWIQSSVLAVTIALMAPVVVLAQKANEATDKAEREKVDKLNQADSLVFQTEKQLKDYGDKIPADKKGAIEQAAEKLKEAHKAQDIAGIDTAMADAPVRLLVVHRVVPA